MTDREKIDAYFERYSEKMLEDLRILVRIPSVRGEALSGRPFGAECARVLDAALEIARGMGFAVQNFDNYVGTINFNDEETALGILAHLDVMPEGTGWSHPAFDVTIEDGRAYGRGTADDKGPAIAALYAMCAARDIRPKLKKNIRLILGTDEECGSSDIEYYFAKEAAPPNVFSPDADFPLINVEKGRLSSVFEAKWSAETPKGDGILVTRIHAGERFNAVPDRTTAQIRGIADGIFSRSDLERSMDETTRKTGISFELGDLSGGQYELKAFGVNAHGSMPENGNNSLTGLLELVSRLPLEDTKSSAVIRGLKEMFPHGDTVGKALGIDCQDEVSGSLSMNFSILDLDEKGFRASFDCRCPVSADLNEVLENIKTHLEKFGAHITDEGITPPHEVPEDSPFVQTLLRIYHEYTGNPAYALSTGGGTYVHNIEGGVAFGCTMPGVNNRMHGADEFANVDDLIMSAKMFTQAILDICG